KNQHEEETLLASLKADYIVISKAVAHFLDANPSAVSDVDELKAMCNLMSIDEIHIFDETGTIFSGTQPEYYGYSFYDGDQLSYFIPMLSDKTLSMCQDVTPNTAAGKPMMYAITWNEDGTMMVQVGIEPVRFIEALKANEIQATIQKMTLDNNVSVIAADAKTLMVVGSKNEEYNNKHLFDVTSLTLKAFKRGFLNHATISNRNTSYFAKVNFTDKYCLVVFLDYGAFVDRTLQSMLVVFIYLLIACFAVLFVFKRLSLSRKENSQHLQVFQSMSEIYYSLHLIDLENNTAMEYSSRNEVKNAFGKKHSTNAKQTMVGIMHATMSDEYLERGLAFTDLSTIQERMKGKKIISMELLGKNVGWIRMSFVTHEERDGVPTKVIIATQIIDEEKKKADSLYAKSHMDELTGCFNRRAYNEDVIEFEKDLNESDFVYISFDVNGLKTVNDTLGHEAGDELISGAAECMKKAFMTHGRIYRTGGDEFVGLLHADKEHIDAMCEEFNKQISTFDGKFIKEITVSYGIVLSGEANGIGMNEIAALADKRMYESKDKYYKEKGIERRRT
nr:GGDEF domain-containing protein [Bacilli bacterium]